MKLRRSLPFAFVLVFAAPAVADNWPAWRGPTGDGKSMESNPPLKWSAKENVRWKVALPDVGNASPVVWGDRVFITQATNAGKIRGVMAFDRGSGKQLWFSHVEYNQTEPTHNTNPIGSATPVVDGERVIASLGSAGLICFDFAGKQLWHRDLGKFHHIWGNASSPILYRDLCILWCGPGERQFLLAVNMKTGQDVWRVDIPGGKFGTKSDQWVGSWSTPIIASINGRDEMILGVPEKVKAFDPKTGTELWSCDGLGKLVYTSPVISSDGIVVVMSGYSGPALAVRAGGTGDVTKTHRLWHHARPNPQRIGSAVISGNYAYILNEQGFAQCLDVKTGDDLWNRERISSGSWGSMVLAGGRLYVTNLAGETYVLKADPKLEQLAKNPLGERVLASIAPVNNQIFIRGYKHLWCIEAR
jgi:outer membrane protein assembly factor BamB